MEMHLVSRANQIVNAARHSFAFKAGERLHAEDSHKFTTESFADGSALHRNLPSSASPRAQTHFMSAAGRTSTMETKSIKLPGPDHPITIEPNPVRVIASVAGRIIADTRSALTLNEAGHAAVQYIPQKDVDMTLLKRTDHHTYCPYKGDCSYYSIPLGGERSVDPVWTYEAPYVAVAAIKDHVAFYADRVDAVDAQQESKKG
jgi:uncharacterized protein (DUF427 family)